jgi:hypothetical protein
VRLPGQRSRVGRCVIEREGHSGSGQVIYEVAAEAGVSLGEDAQDGEPRRVRESLGLLRQPGQRRIEKFGFGLCDVASLILYMRLNTQRMVFPSSLHCPVSTDA